MPRRGVRDTDRTSGFVPGDIFKDAEAGIVGSGVHGLIVNPAVARGSVERLVVQDDLCARRAKPASCDKSRARRTGPRPPHGEMVLHTRRVA